MRKLGIRRLQRNNQVVIPKEATEILNVVPGDAIIYIEESCGIVIKKLEISGAN